MIKNWVCVVWLVRMCASVMDTVSVIWGFPFRGSHLMHVSFKATLPLQGNRRVPQYPLQLKHYWKGALFPM